MNFCSNCGKGITPNQTFCEYCGTPIILIDDGKKQSQGDVNKKANASSEGSGSILKNNPAGFLNKLLSLDWWINNGFKHPGVWGLIGFILSLYIRDWAYADTKYNLITKGLVEYFPFFIALVAVLLLTIRGFRNGDLRKTFLGKALIGLGIIISILLLMVFSELYTKYFSSDALMATELNLKYWNTRFTPTSDGYVSYIPDDTGLKDKYKEQYGIENKTMPCIYQFRDCKFYTSSGFISEEDKAKGYEWAAKGHFTFVSKRIFDFYSNKWDAWQPYDNVDEIFYWNIDILRHKNGKWDIRHDDKMIVPMAIDIDEVPIGDLGIHRIALKQQLKFLAAKAFSYYIKPQSLGGGGNSFEAITPDQAGMDLLYASTNTDDGAYSIQSCNAKDSLVFLAIGKMRLPNGSFPKYICNVIGTKNTIIKLN